MSSTPRRPRFPLPLDAVVERKPAPARTAGMPAVGKRVAAPAPATVKPRKPAAPPAAPPPPGSAVEARASAATAGGGGMASDRASTTLAARLRAGGIRDERVLGAIATVPRHLFMEPGLASQAYEDAALPIGHQQTISKPSVVSRMIELLREGMTPDQPLARVLEIGTGCGYQAAVLSLCA
ncbi:MAG: protein-L-isoaspartate O-methyltransferase, partial [Cupriavidus sp.]|nr:protein-L-isoaspartate O-methyltransferase [Cupriavidus sp.]